MSATTSVVIEGENTTVVIGDLDDDEEGLETSDLFRSTMSPDLNQYEDKATDHDEYYLGRELAFISNPIISAVASSSV